MNIHLAIPSDQSKCFAASIDICLGAFPARDTENSGMAMAWLSSLRQQRLSRSLSEAAGRDLLANLLRQRSRYQPGSQLHGPPTTLRNTQPALFVVLKSCCVDGLLAM